MQTLYYIANAAVVAAVFWQQVAIAPSGSAGARQMQVVPAIVPVPSSEGTPGAVQAPTSAAPPAAPRFAPMPPTAGRVGTVAAAPRAVATPPPCKAVLSVENPSVPALGGTVDVRAAFVPATCAAPPVPSARWVQLSKGVVPTGVYRYSVPPNLSGQPRSVVIRSGDQSVSIEQAAGRWASLAAAPSKLVFAVAPDQKPASKTLALWTDEKDLAIAVSSGSEQWLKVSARSAKGSPRARWFDVAVDPARMQPGNHGGSIVVTATGVVNPPLVIPVVVEVYGRAPSAARLADGKRHDQKR